MAQTQKNYWLVTMLIKVQEVYQHLNVLYTGTAICGGMLMNRSLMRSPTPCCPSITSSNSILVSFEAHSLHFSTINFLTSLIASLSCWSKKINTFLSRMCRSHKSLKQSRRTNSEKPCFQNKTMEISNYCPFCETPVGFMASEMDLNRWFGLLRWKRKGSWSNLNNIVFNNNYY